jgi:GTP-binding protein
MSIHIHTVKKLPPVYKGTPRPAIAVAGRSNVGKSTLINLLLDRKVAATSKQPGRTRGVHRYLINERWDLVDLPGYGYAKVGEDLRSKWRQMVSDFLVGHGNLSQLLILVDSRRGLADLDNEMLQWAIEERVGASIILTKFDKLKRTDRSKIVRAVQHSVGEKVPVYPVSTLKREGITELFDAIELWWSDDRFQSGS